MNNFSFVFFKAMLIARTNLQGSLRRGIGSVLFWICLKTPNPNTEVFMELFIYFSMSSVSQTWLELRQRTLKNFKE